MAEKWQEALLKWDVWNKSLKDGRIQIEKKFRIKEEYESLAKLMTSCFSLN